LEKYIQRMYEQTRDFVSTHRFGRPEDDGEGSAAPQESVGSDGEPVGEDR